MKTANYQLDLMTEYQLNKAIIFNENTNKLDWLLNRAVIDFVAAPPATASEGELYIIQHQTQHVKLISYSNNIWNFYDLAPGAIFYVLKAKDFYLLTADFQWQQIGYRNQALPAVLTDWFTSVSGTYELLPKLNLHYLYIDNSVEIKLNAQLPDQTTLIIKQNATANYNLTFTGGNIIWPNNTELKFQLCPPNAIQLIKLYKLPDSSSINSDLDFLVEVSNNHYLY